MSLKYRVLETVIFTGLIFWGLVSLIQGAGLSIFVGGEHQVRDEIFIELLYCSVVVAALLGLFYPRVVAAIAMSLACLLIIMLFLSNGFGHGNTTIKPLLWAIVFRPFLAGLLLFLLHPVGPLGRLLKQGR